jgi:hypothetical protein
MGGFLALLLAGLNACDEPVDDSVLVGVNIDWVTGGAGCNPADQ